MSFVIRGKIPHLAPLRCQDGDTEIPFDVTFKIFGKENASVGTHETNVDVKEVRAHKLILASSSPVFKKMFYGAIKETKDVIPVEQSTADAFSLLLDYFYQKDINCKDMTVAELFDLVNLAEKYDVPELMVELTGQMEIVTVTMKNIIEVATLASKFSYFEAASSTLLKNCAKVFQQNVKDRDQIKFLVAQHEEGNGIVAHKLLTLVESLPPLVCNNCDEKECWTGSTVPWNKLEEGVKVKVNACSRCWDNVGGPWAYRRHAAVNVDSVAKRFQLSDENGSVVSGGPYPYNEGLSCAGGISTLVYDC